MSTAAEIPSRPRRRWRIALALLLVCLAAPPAYLWYRSWSAERELAAVMAELDRSDPGWRLPEILDRRPKLPDERNSAVQVLALHAMGLREFKEKEEKAFESLTYASRLNLEQAELLRQFFADQPEARAASLKLKDLPDGHFDMAYDPDWITHPVEDHVQKVREVLRFQHWEVMLRVEDEDPQALDACRAMLNASRSLRNEPGLVAHLVRIACLAVALDSLQRVLAQSEPPGEALAAMQEALANEVRDLSLVGPLRGERAGGFQSVMALRSGKLSFDALLSVRGPGTPTWEGVLRDLVVRASGGLDEAGYLRRMNDYVEAAKLPQHEQLAAVERIDGRLSEGEQLLRAVLPSCQKLFHAQALGQAMPRTALVALAAERYRQARGAWPAAARDLVAAGLLAEVPADPHDGEPLRWRRFPDGVAIYSVGDDRVDNGGNVDPNVAYRPGGDVGFRLYDPAARRQEPAAAVPQE